MIWSVKLCEPPVVSTAVRSKAVVLLLFIVAPIVYGFCVFGSCFVVKSFVFSLVLQSAVALGKRELVALLLLSSWYHVVVTVLSFLMILCV